jgi:hypothetical protein
VFDKRVQRRMFGPLGEELAGGLRKLHDEELHNLYSLPDIIKMIKSRRMRWAGYVAHMGKMRNAFKIFVRKPEGKGPFGKPRHGSRFVLKSILQKQGFWLWTGFMWLRIGYSGKLMQTL